MTHDPDGIEHELFAVFDDEFLPHLLCGILEVVWEHHLPLRPHLFRQRKEQLRSIVIKLCKNEQLKQGCHNSGTERSPVRSCIIHTQGS